MAQMYCSAGHDRRQKPENYELNEDPPKIHQRITVSEEDGLEEVEDPEARGGVLTGVEPSAVAPCSAVGHCPGHCPVQPGESLEVELSPPPHPRPFSHSWLTWPRRQAWAHIPSLLGPAASLGG